MKSKTPRVLVVDDSLDIAKSLSSILELNEFRVDTALNGSDALRKIQSKVYDIVVCDIEMPGMSGLDFLERIRKDGRSQEVILMTGYLEPEYFIRAIRLGASDFINKPIDSSQLVNAIEHILARKSDRETLGQLLSRLDNALLSFVIDPGKYVQHGISKVCTHFLQQNLAVPQDLMTELLICVDEMVYNAFIHGTLGLTQQQRKLDHKHLQEIISEKLAQPHIAARRIRFELCVSHEDDCVCISVEDDGDGFDYETCLQKLLKESALNLEDTGRGLAVLYHLSDSLDFLDGGRKVRISRKLHSSQLAEA
ncbi:MAG: response regulator [Candidatus Syntrophosphaera sp.]|nr:response regulator [Candidatus Syntrophosphaera sp.]